MPRSLQWRIALAYTALIVISMVAASIYIFLYVRGSYISDLEVRLENEARLIGQTAESYFQGQLDPGDIQAASERIGNLLDARISIIRPDGTVLSDTWDASAVMENHADRPEVRDALAAGIGRSTRFDSTVEEEMMYAAVPVYVDGTLAGVARVAVPMSEVQSKVDRILSALLLSGLIVTLLSVVLGYFLARRTSRSVRSVAEGVRHITQGDLEHRVYALSGDETSELAADFNRMAATLKTTIQELSAERNKLSVVLEVMADGVVMIGSQGDTQLLNPVARELLDIERLDFQGRSFIELSRNHELQLMISRAFETHQPQYGEVEFSQRRFLSAIAIPLVDSNSHPGVLLTLHDLSRLRQLDTTRREFISNVSHELRSPLASIKASVETLENGALGEPEVARDFIRRIHEDIGRMINMAGDLLELSRLESGQVPIHLYPLDLRPLLEDVRTGFEGRAVARAISINATYDEDVPLAMGDEEKLRQALVNLLDNAIKFTPDAGRITLTTLADGGFVEVRVNNTGMGIPREHLPHVFERFYKVDRSRHDGGTGLGLAIVNHIVQLHGGEVTVQSQEGESATFSFTLPRVQ
ncbi:MAG: HAMP domain-containing protein [Dehalococcoidia bacterium]|nr:HAMP domain-containing protein [Dehalococcoidia bacterium]